MDWKRILVQLAASAAHAAVIAALTAITQRLSGGDSAHTE